MWPLFPVTAKILLTETEGKVLEKIKYRDFTSEQSECFKITAVLFRFPPPLPNRNISLISNGFADSNM